MFGGLIASGWHTGAMLMRMICDHAIPGSATTGALGFDDLKWLKPVRPGDILSVETVVREKTRVAEPARYRRGQDREPRPATSAAR